MEVRIKIRDGISLLQLKCPRCGQWADIDDDQYHGQVSIFHDIPDCGFHETINVVAVLKGTVE